MMLTVVLCSFCTPVGKFFFKPYQLNSLLCLSGAHRLAATHSTKELLVAQPSTRSSQHPQINRRPCRREPPAGKRRRGSIHGACTLSKFIEPAEGSSETESFGEVLK